MFPYTENTYVISHYGSYPGNEANSELVLIGAIWQKPAMIQLLPTEINLVERCVKSGTCQFYTFMISVHSSAPLCNSLLLSSWMLNIKSKTKEKVKNAVEIRSSPQNTIARFIALRSYFSAVVLQSEPFRSSCCKLWQKTRDLQKQKCVDFSRRGCCLYEGSCRETGIPSGGTGARSHCWEHCASWVTSIFGHETIKAVLGRIILFQVTSVSRYQWLHKSLQGLNPSGTGCKGKDNSPKGSFPSFFLKKRLVVRPT